MFKRIDHIEIVSGDIERTIRFYVEILGFRVELRHKVSQAPLKEVVYLKLNDTTLELLSVENPPPSLSEPWRAGYKMMAIEVEDMEKSLEYLKSKGVEITWGPVDLGRSVRAEIKDSDGISIELREWKKLR